MKPRLPRKNISTKHATTLLLVSVTAVCLFHRTASATEHHVIEQIAGITLLSTGNNFIHDAAEGLSFDANLSADGISSFAKFGGGLIRQGTENRIDVKNKNTIIAIGHKEGNEKSVSEYGAFFEYGSGNYTTYNKGLRVDGSAKYSGVGILTKWTNDHGFYVDGSFRVGAIHDDDEKTQRNENFAHESDTNYWGAHIGVGKTFLFKNDDTVDVYGKYIFNHRNEANLIAKGLNLDAINSHVVRAGIKYLARRNLWRFYSDVSYEYEFDGKTTGTIKEINVCGDDIKGGSIRAELGATLKPHNDSLWSLDFSLAGIAGKKQGVVGGMAVSVEF